MEETIKYCRFADDLEYVYHKNTLQSYARHTHANHMTLGYVMEGAVCVACRDRKTVYCRGGSFCIMPDVPHAVEAADGAAYSMISVCVPFERSDEEAAVGSFRAMRLKKLIADAPENIFPIEDMARETGVSPYHMIRRFKAVCGLTPHQFQIQCRVRRAQRLLEEGESVAGAAYGAGFCDQSHLDRCFRRIVRLSPREYQRAVKRFV